MEKLERFDPNFYVFNDEDFQACNADSTHFTEEEFEIANEMSLIPKYNEQSLVEKYMAWTMKFKELEPMAMCDEESVVTCFGIPVVDEAKSPKLLKLLKMIASKKFTTEAILKNTDIDAEKFEFSLVPNHEKEGHYLPVLFIPCGTAAIAEHVSAILDGSKIGSKNVMRTCVMSQVGEFMQCSPVYTPLEDVSMLELESDLFGYMNDGMAREQFLVVNTEKKAELMWNDPVLKQPQPAADAPITCAGAKFSQNGALLFTIHKKGVKVRGGAKLEQLTGLLHEEVWEVLGSPDERYLLSWNGLSNQDGSNRSVAIHDLWSNRCVRTTWCPLLSCDGSEVHPFFCWSPCSQYLACNNGTAVQILQAPSFSPLVNEDGTPWTVPIKNPRSTFAWSPTDPFLAVWTPPVGTDKTGHGEGPCSLKIIDVVTRRSIASKSLNVELDNLASVFWHPQGNFLAIRLNIMQKISKKKRKQIAQIEIFHIRLGGCPSDSILIPTDTSALQHVAFEPIGDRFAILMSDQIKIWSLKRDASKANSQEICTRNLGTMSKYNQIFWSPQGTFFALAGIDEVDGPISFNTVKSTKDVIKIDEIHYDNHYAMNKLVWDPSGRYVASVVRVVPGPNTDFSKAAESSYRLWTFQGKELYFQKNTSGTIMDFVWRPHPAPVLSVEKVKDLQRNVAKYGDKYNSTDDALKSAALNEAENHKQELLHKFQSSLDTAAAIMAKDPMCEEWNSMMETYLQDNFEYCYDDIEEGGLISSEVTVIKAAN